MKYKPDIDQGLYVITDCARLSPEELLRHTQQILEAGVAALQFRDKTANGNKMETGGKLKALCRKYNALFIVNDDVELAANLQADGLHLGRDDDDYRRARELLGDNVILGLSCYNDLDRATEAQTGGVDYVAFGSVFPTTSKENTVHASLELIKIAKQKLHVPVAAIGGITPDNCAPLVEAGVDLLAVISSVYQSPAPRETVEKFNRYFSHHEFV
jgi:thiamine-phosphate pyrophosphorylase